METKMKFEFSDSFKQNFDILCSRYNEILGKLKNATNKANASDTKPELGLCADGFAFRYVSADDLSDYIDGLVRCVSNGMLDAVNGDTNTFAVAWVMRKLSGNGSDLIKVADTKIHSMTLRGLLNLVDLNDVYGEHIISGWEMLKRAGCGKFNGCVSTISSLDWVTKVKRLISGIGSVLESSGIGNQQVMDYVRMSIEEMLMFVATLNIKTMLGMEKFVEPRCEYGATQLVDTVKESVDLSIYKPIFLVLSEGKTPIISNGIKQVTGSNFSHISISFDPGLELMYSFGGPVENDVYENEEYGCRKEAIKSNLYDGIYAKVFVGFVSSDNWGKMMNACEEYANADTKFDWRIFRNKIFGIDKMPSGDNKYAQVCSTFVNTLFGDIGLLNMTGKNAPTPADWNNTLLDSPEWIQIFYGKAETYDAKYYMIAEKFANKAKSKPVDMVTECCLLKTGSLTYHNSLPFNCNFRDIVLNDTTPKFSDVTAALIYILSNGESPIAMLIEMYNKSKRPLFMGGDACCGPIIRMLGGCNPQVVYDIPMNPNTLNNRNAEVPNVGHDLYEKLNSLGFHTDVSWLDKIAYANNNYLNGNYRTDMLGNQNRTPITNMLDMLWKMYNPCECNSSTECVERILDVSDVMMSIIQSYNAHGYIDNYQLFKDVLALLGEILTRLILKLYANNTQIIRCGDDMDNTGGPGYMYSESFQFFIEADDNNNNASKGVTQGATVQVKSADGKSETKVSSANNKLANAKANVAAWINKFINWVRKTLKMAPTAWLQRHQADIKEFNDNKDLNDEIENAINDSSFQPSLVGYHEYSIQVKGIQAMNKKLTEVIRNNVLVANNKTNPNDALKLIYNSNGTGASFNNIKMDDDEARSKAFISYGKYGKVDPPQENDSQAVKLDQAKWTDICKNISQYPQALNLLTNGGTSANSSGEGGFSKSCEDASKVIDETAKNLKSDVADELIDNAKQVIKTMSDDYTKLLTALNKDVFVWSFKTYKNIIAAYKTSKENASKNDKSDVKSENDFEIDSDSNGTPEDFPEVK